MEWGQQKRGKKKRKRQSGTEAWLDTEKPVQGYKQEGQHHPNGGTAYRELRK